MWLCHICTLSLSEAPAQANYRSSTVILVLHKSLFASILISPQIFHVYLKLIDVTIYIGYIKVKEGIICGSEIDTVSNWSRKKDLGIDTGSTDAWRNLNSVLKAVEYVPIKEGVGGWGHSQLWISSKSFLESCLPSLPFYAFNLYPGFVWDPPPPPPSQAGNCPDSKLGQL